MSSKRRGERGVLSRQEIAVRKRALKDRKQQRGGGQGRRAIVGVVLLAASVLTLLAVASFDVRDRLGPGFKNLIGPVGHALAEGLRGFFGITALALPALGLYAAFTLFIGDREKRRWPQVLALALLVVCGTVLAQLTFREDPSWAHAPGGLMGRQLAQVLTALFSTVGTVVLVSATASVAFIVGTEYAFLRLCGWAWEAAGRLAGRARVLVVAALEAYRSRADARREQAEQDQVEEAEFLAQLEAQESELSELEAAATEAEAAAEEVARQEHQRETQRLGELAERERLKVERERLLVEREAARLAREALKTARATQKDSRKDAAAALAPALLAEAGAPLDASPAPLNGDPAWAASLSALHAPGPVPLVPPAVQRRVPTIVELPPLPEITAPSVAGAPGAERSARVPAPTAPMAPPPSALMAAPPQALALAPRVPLIVEPKAPPRPTRREEFQFVGGRTRFVVPPLDVLEVNRRERPPIDKEAFLSTAEKLTAKLRDFGIEGEVVEIRPGPVVTMYEFKPAAGVKISRIASLADDLAMAMEAMRVRIVAPIPGKGVVGIEVPNKERELVFLKEIAEQDAFQKSQSRLAMCLGKDIEGMPYILDLAKAPHLLMAGTTGSGKSVSVNAMIMSILLKSTPEEVRFIMVDPKMLELSVYEGIPHLLLPVVTDPRKAAIALQWAVDEMTRRYKLLAEAGVRNIAGYNLLVEQEQARAQASRATVEATPTVIRPPAPPPPPAEALAEASEPPSLLAPPPRKKKRMLVVDVSDEAAPTVEAAAMVTGELGVAAPAEPSEDPREGVPTTAEAVALAEAIRVDEAVVALESQEEAAALARAAQAASEAPEERKKLPYIVVIIDELADLMMVASKEVETSIARLAQMARAAGLHLMVATQRPSTDVVTGVIKANFPTRISFMLRTKPDSMTILGTIGAEALLGMGDMLIMPPTSAHMQRVHGCFVSEPEIKKVVDHLKAQGTPVYDESILKPRDGDGESPEDDLSDELYDQAIAIVAEMRQVSISMLQRKMRIGYNRSARMIERMEREGLVGAADGAKPRDVLIRPVGQMEA